MKNPSRTDRRIVSKKSSKNACFARTPFLLEGLESRDLFAGVWSTVASTAPYGVGTMTLLPDGSVLAADGGNNWSRLVPNASGSYINGTWQRMAAMHDTRLYDSTQVLQDGRVFIAGGEYGTGASTGEVYSPITNTWTNLPAQSFGKFIDAMSTMLPDGRVLIGPVAPSPAGFTTIFNPATNTWTQGPKTVRGGSTDEQTWVKLPDDSILTIDSNTTSERYIPATNTWINDAAVPVAMFDNLGEIGAGTLLTDGRVFYIGATGHTLYYTPSGSTANGSWAQGPDVPAGLGQDDAPAVLLPDGKVMMVVGPITVYSGPSTIYIFDPVTGTYSTTTGAPSTTGAPFVHRFLDLPDGTVLFSTGGSTVYDYNPNVTPAANAVPTITSLTPNADGTVTLAGTLLNGITEGASYGDDAQMNTNFPVVRLVSGTNVYYARTSNWDSTGVATGATIHTTKFTLPLGIPAGTYSVYLTANGIASAPSTLTISMTAGNAAPTVVTAAAASPSPVTTTSTTLSVLGADDAGESNLVYTWVPVTVPSGKMLPSYSINGTNAAKTTTVTFSSAGTYTFKVYITDTGGLSVTSTTVSVVVNQTKSSIAVSPVKTTNTTSTTRTFTATAYDQFGTAMAVQPTFTWSVTAGTGTVSASGVYTAPATGTLATVHVTDGTFSADAEVGVVNSPWASSDIGTPTAGQAYSTGSTFTVQGGGADIWGTADDFRYVYKTMTGDGVITARVASQTNTGAWAKAGVMFRNSLADNDQYVMMMVTPGNGTALQYRATSAASAIHFGQTTGLIAPYWVRIVRSGTSFSAYRSSDGATWTLQGTVTVAMGTTVYVGLAADANSSTAISTVTFDNVTANAFPTVATAAAANPATVTGTTTTLTALGADDNGEAALTYTWTTTGTPPGTVTYSVNGTNAAKSTVATFTAAGTYTFQVTITDASGATITSSVSVIVKQTATTIAITPANPTLSPGQSTTFTAVEKDQFGTAMATQPKLIWTIVSGGGSLDSTTGQYTADASGSSATISATDFVVTGTTTITVTGTAPQITTATASTVTGKTSNLSVVATDNAGEANLIYTWSVISMPANAFMPTFSTNANNAAKNAVVTFNKAGNYTLGLVVLDAAGMSVNTTVNVVVAQVLNSIIVSPNNFKVTVNTQQQFKAVAYDQFNLTMGVQPTFTWASTSGSVTSTGLFTAGAIANTGVNITATSGAKVGTASITTRAAGIPLAPGSLSVKKSAGNTLSLNWRDNSTNETSFEIQYGTGTNLSNINWTTSVSTTAKLGAVSTVTYAFASAFSAGQTYFFRVRAINAFGASSWSNIEMQSL